MELEHVIGYTGQFRGTLQFRPVAGGGGEGEPQLLVYSIGAVAEVQQMVEDQPLGADVRMHIGGQGEELQQSINSLLFAFALAVFMVYLVMASQFESLLHPFVILFAIPLALVGAVLALFLTRSPVSVVVFIVIDTANYLLEPRGRERL